MALTWEYYPSSLMTNVEDDGLARLWLKQPVVLERECYHRGVGGEWPVSSAACLASSDHKLWKQTCHFKKKRSDSPVTFCRNDLGPADSNEATINGEHSK